jgi:hypothetical protein
MFPVLSANSASGYFLTKSLRFRQSATAYMQRTPASSGSRTTWTWSGWIKLAKPGVIFESNGSGSLDDAIVYSSSTNALQFYVYNNTYIGQLITSAVYRDPSAWYHVVAVWDTTQATASNRMKLYVNGSQITAFSTANYPAQNSQSTLNTATAHGLGAWPNGGLYGFDGYLAEVNFVDGQALTPSSFGSTNALTGVWQPTKYTGTYGTNGFYLPFTNTTSTSTLGNDFSGNGNNWTTNNFSLTTGPNYDSMNDVPTLTSATVSNACTWNPLNFRTSYPTAFADGNLKATFSNAGVYQTAYGTIAVSSGKYYWEVTVTAVGSQTIIGVSQATYINDTSTLDRIYTNGGSITGGGSGASYTTNDVIGVALDIGGGTVTFYKNGTSQGSATLGTLPANGWTPYAYGYNGCVVSPNFGQQPFAYSVPSGFVALNTYNLPTATIVKGNNVMDATLYTGTGASQSVTNASGFQPDFVWIKSRSAVSNHGEFDSVRPSGYALYPNLTDAEANNSSLFTGITSTGFGVAGTNVTYNQNAATYVAWQWQAGKGTTSSNTSGSITSTVSVNTSAGFSISTYAGTGANATVGHGLGVAPQFVIVKNRTLTDDWCVYSLPTGAANYAQLNLSSAFGANSTIWNNTAPTSSVFSVGTYLSKSGSNYVAYCWTPIAGFSAVGSYTGNGSSDGPFIYTGFRPKFIMIKRTDSTGDWIIWDTARPTYNTTYILYPNLSAAEDTSGNIGDILSNGFKARSTGSATNASGGTYIYAAFAENPFKNALAR